MNISRRSFLTTGAAGIGLLAARGKAKPVADDPVDALVIGSGFGGAIAALRLAEAGINTVVLERGIRWPIKDARAVSGGNYTFCTFQNPDGRASWLNNIATGLDPDPVSVYTGVMELIGSTGNMAPGVKTGNQIAANGITVRTGAGVGGGSLVYNAIMLQPTRELFERVFPAGISFEEMEEVYYPRVRSILKCSAIPTDILDTPYYLSTVVNLEQAENAGFTTRLVEYNVDWHIVRDEIKNKRVPSAIAGQSWFGLNSGAKNSVDHNYLPMAEKTGRVQILTLHVVTDITYNARYKNYTVTANIIDTSGSVQSTRTFTTSRLFIAAGSVGTAALLTKARTKGLLPNLSPFAGAGWGNNGDFIVFRGTGVSDHAGEGGPCGHILMQDVNNPYSPTNMVELVVPRSDATPGSPFFIPASDGKVASSLYVGLGIAPPVGYFTYDPTTDTSTLNWPAPTDPRLVNWANGAQSLDTTLDTANPGSFTAFFGNNLTAHPVGGANAGVVCDLYGRVKGHRGLYVVDGAFVPGGSVGGVNPSFTIAALAERSMENIIGDFV